MDAKKDAEQREYEERLQRRLKILKQQFEQGKIHIAEGLKVTDSLKAVRALPDGTIDYRPSMSWSDRWRSWPSTFTTVKN